MAADNDPNLMPWALGAISAALSGALTWLSNRVAGLEARLDNRIGKVEDLGKTLATSSDLKDLWAAHTAERDRAQAYREDMLRRMGEVPTKHDLTEMERRLLEHLRPPR
jgi:hypothetical protein